MDNKQQLLYIQTLFGTFSGTSQFVNVVEKHGSKMRIELYPSEKILAYRVHFEDNTKSLWTTWEDKEDVERYFKTASLIA